MWGTPGGGGEVVLPLCKYGGLPPPLSGFFTCAFFYKVVFLQRAFSPLAPPPTGSFFTLEFFSRGGGERERKFFSLSRRVFSFHSFPSPRMTYHTWFPTIFHGGFFLFFLFSHPEWLITHGLLQCFAPSADTLRILTYTLYMRSTYCWGGGRGRALSIQVWGLLPWFFLHVRFFTSSFFTESALSSGPPNPLVNFFTLEFFFSFYTTRFSLSPCIHTSIFSLTLND